MTAISAVQRTLFLLAALACLLLAGCGSDDTDAPLEEATGNAEAADNTENDDESDAEDEAETVEVTLVDFAFEGLPATIDAGTRLEVTNAAPSELHELVAFRLPDDEARSVEELAELPPGELMTTLGEPSAVLLAEPDGPMIPAVGDGALAEPGRYGVFCFIPTGADPQEYLDAAAESDGPPEVDGGPPHFVHGMLAELTVE